jgi:hypothetical protein
MLIAQSLSSSQLVALGFLILATGLLLRRGAALGKRSGNRDLLKEVRHEMHQAEQTGASLVQQMEVRLHDYDREIAGRMQTTISVLDQLMVEADREIERLEQLLQETNRISRSRMDKHRPDVVISTNEDRSPEFAYQGREPGRGTASQESPLTPEQCRGIRHLSQAGFTPEEIARCLDRSRKQILAVLNGKSATDNDLADAA